MDYFTPSFFFIIFFASGAVVVSLRKISGQKYILKQKEVAINDLLIEIQNITRTVVTLETTNQRMQSAGNKLLREYKDLKMQYDSILSEQLITFNEHKDLVETYNTLVAKHQLQIEENKGIIQKLKATSSDVKGLQDTNNGLKKNIESLLKERSAFALNVNELQVKINKLIVYVDELENALNASVSNKLKNVEKKRAYIEAEIETTIKEITELELKYELEKNRLSNLGKLLNSEIYATKTQIKVQEMTLASEIETKKAVENKLTKCRESIAVYKSEMKKMDYINFTPKVIMNKNLESLCAIDNRGNQAKRKSESYVPCTCGGGMPNCYKCGGKGYLN